MAKMADIVLVTILWIYIYKGAALITPNRTSWGNAFNNCTMATPTIMFQDREKDILIAVNARMIGNKDVWVGYYLAATAFHYVGCIQTGNMTKRADFDHNTPGMCYSACNNSFAIGVSKSKVRHIFYHGSRYFPKTWRECLVIPTHEKCYCLNNTIPLNRTETFCTEGCTTQSNIACGGEYYMSIYTIDSNANNLSGSGRCLQYEFKNDMSRMTWAGCTSPNQIICRFIKDLENLETKNNSGISWAGVISSDVIYRRDHRAHNITPKRFGYLQVNEANDTVLKFHKNRTRQRYTLCQNDKTTETTTFKTTSEKLTAMTSHKKTTESTKSPDKFSPNTSVNSLKTTTETTTTGRINKPIAGQANATKASDIGIAVGVSVATFIIVVIVLVGVILIRRGQIPFMCCKLSLHDKSSKCTMNTSLVISNTLPLDCPNGKVGEVVPQTNTVSEDDVPENNGHIPHDYFILEKTQADNNTTAVQDEVNVYNTLAFHVKQEANFDNTYDTAEKAAMKLKTKHRVKDDSDANETLEDEDPYNHLNEGKTTENCQNR